MRRSMRALLVAAVALGSAGCEAWYNRVPSPDQLWYIIPWFDHMIQQRSVHPYESGAVPRNTVPGTVPITGGEANWEAEFKAGDAAVMRRQAGLVGPAQRPGEAKLAGDHGVAAVRADDQWRP